MRGHPPDIPTDSVATRPKWAWRLAAAVAAVAGLVAVVFVGTGAAPEVAAAPVPEGPEVRAGGIWLPETFRSMAEVRSEPALREAIAPTLEVIGNAAVNQEHVAAVGTRAEGIVRRVEHVEGDLVRAGDALASIESTELGEAEAGIAAVAARVAAAEKNYRREQRLVPDGLTTLREVEEARATLAERKAELSAARQRMGTLVSKGGADRDLPLGHYTLRAPIDGTVLTREVHAGQSVEDTATAFLVADLRYLWVELRIPERHLTLVQRGDAVTIHPMGQQESQQQATVAYVGDLIDPATGTGTVRVDIDNSARILRPGQTVVATVVPQRGERQTLTIADAAVTSIDGVPTVFVESSDGLVRPQAVVLGAKVRDRREVLSGLTAGDRVVTSGVFAIKSELYR